LSCGRGAFGFDTAFGFGSGSGFARGSAFGFSPLGFTHFAGLTMIVDSTGGGGSSVGRGSGSSTRAGVGSGEGNGASGSATGVVKKKTRLNQTITRISNLRIITMTPDGRWHGLERQKTLLTSSISAMEAGLTWLPDSCGHPGRPVSQVGNRVRIQVRICL